MIAGDGRDLLDRGCARALDGENEQTARAVGIGLLECLADPMDRRFHRERRARRLRAHLTLAAAARSRVAAFDLSVGCPTPPLRPREARAPLERFEYQP